MKTYVRASQQNPNWLLIILLLAAFIGISGRSLAQTTTIFSENMGALTTGGPYLISSNTFQNSSTLTYSGTGDIRTSPSSTGAYPGASGGELANLNTTSGLYFQIASISTVGYTSLALSFGVYRTDATTAAFSLKLEYSTDGSTYNPIAATLISSQTGTGWRLLSNLTLPADAEGVSNLRLRWTQTTNNPSATSIRIDDVKLTGISTAPTIVPSSASLTGLNYVVGSGPSTAQSFTLTAANLTAGGGTITATAPTNYEVSTTSATTGFGSSATLSYTGTGTVSPNTVWVRLAAGLAGGSYSGNVALAGGGASASVSVSGTVTVPTPTITSLSPSSLVAGTTGPQTLTITGTNFINGTTTAKFNGTLKPVTYLSSTQISIQLTTAELSTPGTYAVTVNNTGNAATPSFNFAVSPATPAITSLSPPFAIVGSGAQTLTINGTNFYNGPTTAKFNGITKTVTYVSPTQITIPLTATDVNTLGFFSVAVTNTGNGTTAIANFYVSPVNNTCSGAIPITVDAAAITGTVVGATPDFSGGNNDVWYAVTPAVSGTFQVTTSTTAQNLNISVYNAACPASASPFLVTGTNLSNTTETVTFSGIANTTYYIRVFYSTGTQGSFTIQATQLLPPVVTSETVTRMVSTPTTYQIQATNSPTSYTATSLPPGLSVATTTGIISGTPTTVGTYTTSVSATNAAGTGNGTVTFIIVKQDQTITFNPLPPKLASDTLFRAGATTSAGTNDTIAYVSSNPAVATISNDTIQIRGAGTTTITATADGNNFYNSASASQTLTVTQGQDLLAAWDFQTTTNGGTAIRGYSTSPLSYMQNIFKSNLDSGVLYVNGTNGSDNWINQPPRAADVNKTELNAFEGTADNAVYGLSTLPGSEQVKGSIAFVNGNANGVAAPSAEGKSAVFRFNMSKHKNLVVSYATQRTNTGFITQTWSYSTDGTNWTTAQTITNLPLNFGTITLDTIKGLNFAAATYLKVTFTGAGTSVNGNNRLDNIRLNATYGTAPVITTQPANASVCVGTTSTSTFTVAASGDPAPTYQWQYSSDNTTFTNVANNTPAGFTYSINITRDTLTVTTSASSAAGLYYYRAIATNIIGSATSSVATVTVNPTPVATVSANSAYACAGSGGSFTITGTPNSTVSYNLNGGSGTSKTLDGSGNGTVPVGFISSSVTITLTSVSASAATGGCSSTPAGAGSTATITTAPLPAVYNLTGGGNYCPGGTGVPVGLDGSQSGVSYQLLVDNGTTTSHAGSPAAGNGGALSFGNQTTVGTYSVQATNTTTGCVKTGGGTTVMVGQYTPATITADATPATQTVCQNGTPMDLTVTAVGNNLVYQWYSNTTSSTTGGTAITNTNSSSYTPVTTAPGTLYYYVTVSGPCRTVTSRVVSVTVSALPTASFTASSYSACGSAVAIGVSGTNGAIVNYSYTGTATGSGSVTLTGGSATTDGTGTINSPGSPGTYNYTVTSITNGCTGSSGSTTTATIDPAPSITLSSAAGTDNQSICKSGQITTITYSVTSGGTPTVTGLPAGVTSSYGNGVFTIGTPTGNTPTVTGVYPYTVTVPGGACGTPVTISGVITASVSWNPIGQSVDWNTGSNWCSGSIPMPADYVTIPANKPSPVLSGDVEIGSLDLAATRTVSIGSYTLQVNGAVSGAGTLTGSATSNLTTGGTGTVNFTPTAGSNVLRNLAVNGGTLTLGNALNITAGTAAGVVTVSGAGQLATAGNLTLKSDKNGTASVAAHAGTTHIADYITGNVTAERYTDGGIPAGKRAWRLVTSPVTDQTISQAWQEGLVYDATAGPNSQPSTYGTIITGEKLSPGTAGSLGFDYVGGGNNASIKRYDAATNAWVPLPNTNSTLVRGAGAEQAYMLFIRGDRTQSTPAAKGPDNIRATGTLLQGPQTVTVPSGNTFTVVGNPYAAPLNFAQVHAGNTSIQDKFYAWDTHLNDFGAYVVVSGNNGTYQAVPSAIIESGTVSVTQYIQSGQGFLVVPDNGGGTLTITENMKNTTASTALSASPFRVVPSKMKELRVNLNLKGDSSATLADGFLAKFDDYYSDAAAQQEGNSRKAWNFNENLNLVWGGKAHIIEARADVQKTDTLFMQMWYVTKRSYQLQMKADNFTSAPGVHAWLIDNYLGTRQELSLKGDIAAIDFSVTSDSLSSKTNRFMIVFQNNAVVLPVTLTSIKASPQNGGVNVSWTVTNEVNIKGYTVERSTDGGRTYTAIATQTAKNATAAAVTGYTSFDNVPKAGENLYRIRIETKEGTISYSAAVKITIGEGDGSIQIAVYPNPVRDGKVSLQLSNLKAGTYLAGVYSEGGQTVYQKKITISQSNTTQSEELRLGKALAQGSYQLRLTDNKGITLKVTKLIVGR